MNMSLYLIALYVALCVWLIAGWRCVYQSLSDNWGSSSSFFSLKDLFLHLLFLLLAVFGYFSAFSVAKYVVREMPGGFLGTLLGPSQESLLMTQAIGIPCAVLFLWFLNAILPESLKKRVVGASNTWQEWIKGVGLGIVLWPALASVVWVLQFAVSAYHLPVQQHVVEMLVGISSRKIFFTIMALEIALLVPFLEELLFRGYFLSFLKGTIHPFLAYVISALVFAWAHYSFTQQASNYAFLPALFLFGLCAALIREKSSLARIVGLHAGVNCTSMVVLLSGVLK